MVENIKSGQDLEWFSREFSKEEIDEHEGEWIAVKDEKLLSSGKDFSEVFRKAKAIVSNPLLIKIPRKNEILGVS